MFIKNKKIAVVGGGPGGLTLAKLLQEKGADVKVYERDKNREIRQQGATLDLHAESGLKAIKACGLLDEFRKKYRPGADKYTLTDKNLNIVYSEAGTETVEDFDTEFARPEIDRGPLRDLLIDSLNPENIVWDSHFLKMERHENGWNLFFENGTSAYADFVIGADGAGSKVRKFLNAPEKIYAGTTILEENIFNAETNAPTLWKMTGGGKCYALGDNKTIFLSTKGDGSLSVYISLKINEQWSKNGLNFSDKTAVRNWFWQNFEGWSPIWDELFATDELWFSPRPQYYFPLNQKWETQENATMIGDSAHVMPPSGDGVNQAMLDALNLVEFLFDPKYSSLKEALSAFEMDMLQRTSTETENTLELTEKLHSAGNLQYMLDFFNQNGQEI